MTARGPLLNFYAGVVGVEDLPEPHRVRVNSDLQQELSSLFQQQADEFLQEGEKEKPNPIDVIPFEPKSSYRLEKGQVFVIRKFPLPQIYSDAALKPDQFHDLNMDKRPRPTLASIFGTEVSGDSVKRVLFQQFRAPQLLDKKYVMMFKKGVFNHVSNDGITLAHELAAIWRDDNLYFKSFSIVSRFFDLGEFEPKATIEEITGFVSDSIFAFDTEEAQTAAFSMIETDDFLSRRVASIQSKKILSVITPAKARNRAVDFKIQIDVKIRDGKNKIALPVTKKELKSVVKFLNEEFFHGELTQERYETNSLRRLNE